MTIEEQRYFDECRKVLNTEQMESVTIAMDYGLQISDIQKVVQSNKNALCMKAIIFACMENIPMEVIAYLCEKEFNQYQIREISEGIKHGLSFEQVKSYAVEEMSANRMKKMRKQLEEKLEKPREDEDVQEYIKGLMEIMEKSIKQFKESNERFDALSELVKEHVVEEKNREIKDLYENLRYKDQKIEELQKSLAEKNDQIGKYQSEKNKEHSAGSIEQTAVEKPEPLFEVNREFVQAGSQNSMKKRMFGWLLRGRMVDKDVVGKIMQMDLSAEQLEEVRISIEKNLNDQEIVKVLENNPTPERMRKMREILLLIRQRRVKAGVEDA